MFIGRNYRVWTLAYLSFTDSCTALKLIHLRLLFFKVPFTFRFTLAWLEITAGNVHATQYQNVSGSPCRHFRASACQNLIVGLLERSRP